MDIEKLIEDLRGLLKQYGEKIPYGEIVGAPWTYSMAGDLVWQDPEPYFIEQAATALSTIQDETEKLRAEADGMRSNWYKAVEEVKKLRAELERMKEIMRDNGIMVIPSKYPGGRSEWNIPKPRGQKDD